MLLVSRTCILFFQAYSRRATIITLIAGWTTTTTRCRIVETCWENNKRAAGNPMSFNFHSSLACFNYCARRKQKEEEVDMSASARPSSWRFTYGKALFTSARNSTTTFWYFYQENNKNISSFFFSVRKKHWTKKTGRNFHFYLRGNRWLVCT